MPAQKLLLVDGYNVIHRIPELKLALATGLGSAREKLALLVSRWSHSRPGVECVIVFDGDQQFSGGPKQRLAGIACVFTRTRHGADAEIIRRVRAYAGDKADVTVVSDDNSIRNSCQAHGAAVQPSAFIQSIKSASSPSPAKKGLSPDGKGLGRKVVSDINEELMKKYGVRESGK